MKSAIPILAYHSVSTGSADWIAPFTVSPRQFNAHLDALAEAGAAALTVSALVDAIRAQELPERPVVLTFDDGFADFSEVVAPALAARGFGATVYPTTGFVGGARGPAGERMLDWASLRELVAAGFEVGAHTHTHPQLDTVPARRAQREIAEPKRMLEERLGVSVRSFAYPHGYSSRTVRRMVLDSGYDSACAVGNALSHPQESPMRLSRLLVRSSTTDANVRDWLNGRGAPVARAREQWQTRLWRWYRRGRVWAGARQEVEPWGGP